MTANILNGKQVADEILAELADKTARLLQQGQAAPGLAVILLGDDPASQIYVRNKRRACAEIGFNSYAYDLPQHTAELELLNLIDQLNQDPQVHGILVQLPLPEQINTTTIIERINPAKDVDGFHPYNLGRLAQKQPLLRPCTPYGIMQLLAYYNLNPTGLHATVVGASNIVGRPMTLELLMAGATVTTCHRATRDLASHIKAADLVVVAAGKPNLIQPHWLQPHAIVIDVGIHRLKDGSLRGDLDFAATYERVAWLTPVPNGVGPMTIATLLSNTWRAAKLNNNH